MSYGMKICPFCSLCATEFEKFQMIALVLSWSSQFTEVMWAHCGEESLCWSLHWEATKKTDISKGDYYLIICLPVLFFLFCFVFVVVVVIIIINLCFLFCLVWQLFSPFIDFFIIYSLRRRKWMWTVQQRWMQPRLYQYRREFLLQMPNRFSVEQKGDLRG